MDKEKKDELLKELKELSEKSSIEQKQMMDRFFFKKTFTHIFRNLLVINTVILIVAIFILKHQMNVGFKEFFKYSADQFTMIPAIFLILVFNCGISFFITAINKSLDVKYKKKSIILGFKIILLAGMFLLLNFII